MIVQAIDKKTGNVMYQGPYEVENNKEVLKVYGDACEYLVEGGCTSEKAKLK